MDKSFQPFYAYASKKQSLVALAAVAPMLSGISWTLVVNSTYPLGIRLFFMIMLGVFALAFVSPVQRLFTSGPMLEVNEREFRWQGWSGEAIPWDAVERWKPASYLGIRYITVWLHEPQHHRATTSARWTQRANGWFGLGDISLTEGGLNRTFDDLARAFTHFGPKASR